MEIEVSPTEVLLSDFELWHYALNYWYLPESEVDGEAFEAAPAQCGLSIDTHKPLPDPALDAQVKRSWERMFDLDWSHPDVTRPRPQKSIQGVLWELPLDCVLRAQPFTAKGRRIHLPG